MKLKKAVLLAFVLVLSPASMFLESIKQVEASGTIYIRADGSIDPPTANITTSDNSTYTFTDNNYDSIVVERDNIVVDGAGYTIQGIGFSFSRGIYLRYRNNVTIKNVEVTRFDSGIVLSRSNNNTFIGNTITGNVAWMIGGGITLLFSSNNTITNNIISSNYCYGITLSNSNNNVLIGNTISSNNYEGIRLGYSSNNTLFHNNFINNGLAQAYTVDSINNVWDNGLEGNCWSNYTGIDADNDGIGDTAHLIDANNTDNYPLMGLFSDFEATSEHHVQTVCNSTISDFLFEYFTPSEIRVISFNVMGEDGTTGFCRICIPTALMDEPYTVLVNATEVSYNLLPFSNETHSYLYFTYSHSTQEVIIIPELPTWTSILLILIILTVAIAFYKRRLPKTPTL